MAPCPWPLPSRGSWAFSPTSLHSLDLELLLCVSVARASPPPTPVRSPGRAGLLRNKQPFPGDS